VDLTGHWVGVVAIGLFVAAYSLVITEEFTHLRKSKPVMLAAGIIWGLVAFQYAGSEHPDAVREAVHDYLTEFAQLFLFLLAAMTYVNAMSERNVFLSPVIDNLTTALVMCAVVMAIGQGNPRFIGIACVNIVVAANAGGAFSPFGDITTLMVWQRGIIGFETFFALFIPSVVNFVVPATIMSMAVPSGTPAQPDLNHPVPMKRGARRIMFLFVCTITTAVSFHNFLHLPPFLGMMTGLALLKFFGYYLRITFGPTTFDRKLYGEIGDVSPFDSFREVARVEWDTLLFFFGVIMCVGGLGFIGYLDHTSAYLYGAHLGIPLWGAWPDCRQHSCWHHVCPGRQHPGDGCGAGNGAANERASMVAGDANGRCWWQPALDRLCCRNRTDGTGSGALHLLYSPSLDASYCAWLRAQYLVAHGYQSRIRHHDARSLASDRRLLRVDRRQEPDERSNLPDGRQNFLCRYGSK